MEIENEAPDPALPSLHRYWIWANRMRQLFTIALKDGTLDRAVKRAEELSDSPLVLLASVFGDDMGIFMGYWYGGLYVVIEGWRELGLQDPAVDVLLQDEARVALLKRFRNGAFHFQKHYWDDRFSAIMKDQESFVWIMALHDAFEKWFMNRFQEVYRQIPYFQKYFQES
jgi:hypothetical protein